jgi:hypothetical protein
LDGLGYKLRVLIRPSLVRKHDDHLLNARGERTFNGLWHVVR